MSDILGNTKIILRNSLSKMNEKDKSELISENKYYALLNKKRRRNLSHNNHKNTLSICPSCASSFLRKCYHHINENNNYFNNSESNAINKENKSYQIHEKKETLPKYQIYLLKVKIKLTKKLFLKISIIYIKIRMIIFQSK